MKELYGFKEKSLKEFAIFLQNEKYTNLQDAFFKFSVISGKSKGTVRNMYYALAKNSDSVEIRDKILNGKTISVNKKVGFSEKEEIKLYKNILTLKKEGFSVRSAVYKLAGENVKTALRYQNKWRSAVNSDSPLLRKAISELQNDGKIDFCYPVTEKVKSKIDEEQFERLKDEIDNLINRISFKDKKENEALKEKIKNLEFENMRLKNLLYGGKVKEALFLVGKPDKNVIH